MHILLLPQSDSVPPDVVICSCISIVGIAIIDQHVRFGTQLALALARQHVMLEISSSV